MFKFLSFIYTPIPISFDSRFDLSTSLERLNNGITQRRLLQIPAETSVVGQVSENNVVLKKVTPNVRNSFSLNFTGRFESIDNKIVLNGNFEMSTFVVAFVTVALLLSLLVTLGSIVALVVNHSANGSAWFVPLGGLAVGTGCYAITYIGYSISKSSDIPYISNVIKQAFSRR